MNGEMCRQGPDSQKIDRRRLDYEAMEARKGVACAFIRRWCTGSRTRYHCCQLSGQCHQASMAWRREILNVESL